MLALAWSVYFGFGVVLASLPALITPVRDDLALSYSQVGVVLGAWPLAYIDQDRPVPPNSPRGHTSEPRS